MQLTAASAFPTMHLAHFEQQLYNPKEQPMNGYEAMAQILKAEGVEVLVAEGLGAHAQKVSTPGQLAPAIKRALAVNQEGRPALIEVLTKAEEKISRYWRCPRCLLTDRTGRGL
jgi:hypothetical protein